ncbi:hypothetical protein P280DRAFT_527953 [Massarina eburnea CBS 473.64]|uniref:Uncharacterized protein n=1 Tax=Massarina eburnea CBS 473.64 TaxID=1395130 RepID=A0A6A6RW40_9PLEO|nr:hypothetical protein P280DRAFT_527953 [Massarina eburnea CBS 473.64]
MWKTLASSNGANTLNSHKTPTQSQQANPNGPNHPQSPPSSTQSSHRTYSLSGTIGTSIAPSIGRTLEDVQMEAEINKMMVQEMQSELEDLYRTVDTSKISLETAEVNLAKSKAKLASYEADAAAKDTVIKILQSSLAVLQNDVALNKASDLDFQAAKDELEAKHLTIKNLQSQLEDYRANADFNKQLFEECQIGLKARGDKVDALKAQLSMRNGLIQGYEQQVDILTKTVQAQADKMAAYEDFRMPKLDMPDMLDPQHVTETHQYEKSILQNRIEALEDANEEQTYKLKGLSSQVDTASEQIADARKTIESLKAQLASSEERYKLLYQAKEESDEALALEQKYTAALQASGMAHSTVVPTRADIQTISDLKAKLKTSTHEVTRAHEYIKKADQEMKHMQKVLDDDKEKLAKAKARRAKLGEDAEKAEAQINQLRSEKQGLEDFAHKAEATIAELGRTNQHLSKRSSEQEQLALKFSKQCEQLVKTFGAVEEDTQRRIDDAVQAGRDERLRLEACIAQQDKQIAALESKLKAEKAAHSQLASQNQNRLSFDRERLQLEAQVKQRDAQIADLDGKLKAEKAAGKQSASQAREQQTLDREQLETRLDSQADTIVELQTQLAAERSFSDQRVKEADEKRRLDKERKQSQIDRASARVHEVEAKLRAAEQARIPDDRDAKIARLQEDLRRSRLQNSRPAPSSEATAALESEIEQRLRCKIAHEQSAKLSDLENKLSRQESQLAEAKTRVSRRDEELLSLNRKLRQAEERARRRETAFLEAEDERMEDVALIQKKDAKIEELNARLLSLGIDGVDSDEDDTCQGAGEASTWSFAGI